MKNSTTTIEFSYKNAVHQVDIFSNYTDAVNYITDNYGEPDSIETIGNSISLSSHDTIECEWFKVYVAVRPFSFRYYFAVKQ